MCKNRTTKTLPEVRAAIKEMKNYKASGEDGTTEDMKIRSINNYRHSLSM